MKGGLRQSEKDNTDSEKNDMLAGKSNFPKTHHSPSGINSILSYELYAFFQWDKLSPALFQGTKPNQLAHQVTMENSKKEQNGLKLLIRRYREQFRIPENLNHYSKEDYQAAEQ